MKQHSGGLGSFLNEVTQTADKKPQVAEQIVYIDIDELETNPKNFYGLRDVDELAGLIAVSHLIEPLTVSKQENGKYMLISGHRRRAAVQKLLEEGIYTERKLPCIVKRCGKISIEQENGEIIEFDEDAVEMLNLIASNRGQREERTIDEKLQEVKYLEAFAKAIYNQKNSGNRGRFRSFFAEEILNISKSQLQRIKSMEKLTEKVKAAIDEKIISETAAMELATLTPEEQDAYLEKILSGELTGKVRDIQKFKSSKSEVEETILENPVEDAEDSVTNADETPVPEMPSESVSEENSGTDETTEESEPTLSYPKNVRSEIESAAGEKILSVEKIIDVPEEFEDPQKEAQDWFYQERLAFYERMYDVAKRLSAEEPNELKAAQWGIRASVARYNIEELKLNHGI